ncbi:hypothetical protein CDL15_Pgr013519 [Punica granatum]|uniref:Uncharacterized protein n=1 Tax=Punica granatum TaxID=22663 RepID=A0A218W2F9_PUNGR|nr:hypothetical protein CDL15_Pgr013519 [Punica granatum]
MDHLRMDKTNAKEKQTVECVEKDATILLKFVRDYLGACPQMCHSGLQSGHGQSLHNDLELEVHLVDC